MADRDIKPADVPHPGAARVARVNAHRLAAAPAAAKWGRVEPLIERLREACAALDRGDGGRDHFDDAARAIIAATEPTP